MRLSLSSSIPLSLQFKARNLRVQDVINKLSTRSEKGVNFVIVDACRSDPTARGSASDRPLFVPNGGCVVFGCRPGNTSSDGVPGRNGLLTQGIINELCDARSVNISHDEFFANVRRRVASMRTEQRVQVVSDVLGKFFFRPHQLLLDTAKTIQVRTRAFF